jgi:NADH-ubiquinone oxidoreductase chain 4
MVNMIIAPFVRFLYHYDSLPPSPLVTIIVILGGGFLLSVILLEEGSIKFCLYLSFLVLFIGIYSCLFFNRGVAGFQFFSLLTLHPLYDMSFTLGVDGTSFVFLLLTLFIFPFCFAAAAAVPENSARQFCNYLLAMELLLVLTFTTIDLFYFYVFFESLLIPMFILIGVWGARSRKIKASYYFFLYTLFGSLIMLFGLLYLYFIVGSTNFFVISHGMLDSEQQHLI